MLEIWGKHGPFGPPGYGYRLELWCNWFVVSKALVRSSNAVRFRWYQESYPDNYNSSDVVPWSVDDVYIGPACEQMCNGHGHCVDGGETCVCDEGFTSATCCDAIDGANPTFFKETFEYAGDLEL